MGQQSFTNEELRNIFNLDPHRPQDRSTIAALQAVFIFLVYMHGRFGPRPIAIFAMISLLTVLPLFIALLYSVVMPHHGSLP